MMANSEAYRAVLEAFLQDGKYTGAHSQVETPFQVKVEQVRRPSILCDSSVGSRRIGLPTFANCHLPTFATLLLHCQAN